MQNKYREKCVSLCIVAVAETNKKLILHAYDIHFQSFITQGSAVVHGIDQIGHVRTAGKKFRLKVR